MEPLSLVIPTFSEAETVGAVVREIPEAHRTDSIVAHGGSTNGIQTIDRDEGLVSSTQGKAMAVPARSGWTLRSLPLQ
jgi:hypothetical protein